MQNDKSRVSWNRRLLRLSHRMERTIAVLPFGKFIPTNSQLRRTVRGFLSRYEGRSWTSPRKWLGLPLIDIQVYEPAKAIHQSSLTSTRPLAKGWLAIGDRACGLIAIGEIAVGAIAVGSFSLGLVSLGGLSIGLLSLGVIAIGYAAIGCLALGCLENGGLAVAWGTLDRLKAIDHDFEAIRLATAPPVNANVLTDAMTKFLYDLGAFVLFDLGSGLLLALVSFLAFIALFLIVYPRRKDLVLETEKMRNSQVAD